MPSSENKPPRPAQVEDVDEETGKRVPGTRVKASTSRPKMSSRDRTSSKSKKSYGDTAPPSPRHARPGSSAKESRKVEVVDKASKEDRRKSGTERPNGSKRRSSSRPPSSHDNIPKLSIPRDDPSYYGVKPQSSPVKTIPIRPRATTSQSYNPRPLSYSGVAYPTGHGAGPPISNSAWYNATPYPYPAAPYGTSYPPPSPSAYQYAVTPQIEQDYFAPQPARTLADRFRDPLSRPSSAYGIRDLPHRQKTIDDSPFNDYDDGYTSAAEGRSIRTRPASIREPSRPTATFNKEELDRASMPPPPRPAGILRKTVTDYPRDPSPASGTSLRYSDSQSQYHVDPPRRPLTRNSVSYDLGRDTSAYRIETANNSRRRQSYYGQSASTGSSGNGYEDKMNAAKGYQQEVSGETTALTVEALKKQQRRDAGSSRSTKSSGSREDSDFRRSATTRTTRSGSGADDENVTIKVLGSAKIMVGGAHLELGKEGGEVQIKRQTSLRNGSEKSNSEYGGPRRIDDHRSRSRVETSRPPARTRMSSSHRSSQSYERAPTDHYTSHPYYQGVDHQNWL